MISGGFRKVFVKRGYEMRDYIDRNIRIDGRLIPYTVYTSWEYFELHDRIEDVESFVESNPEIEELVTRILALKQSCFLLLHTAYSCQSLSDSLYGLKLKLIRELKEKYSYEFDDAWMENLVAHSAQNGDKK